MYSRKKIAALSGLIGGVAVACVGLTPAHADGGPGACTRDLLGNLSCTQRIKGEVPEGGTLPHQETCTQSQPLRVPAAMGNGSVLYGPTVTCDPRTVGVPPTRNGGRGEAGEAGMNAMGRILPVDGP
ncbi:hypothetical protein ACF1B0_01040 [Streptomyces anandii]|uniref:hypothetical protein n=1 Tax=Streptomyces anandii TaxID=285454 RepID=UPI0036FEB7A8